MTEFATKVLKNSYTTDDIINNKWGYYIYGNDTNQQVGITLQKNSGDINGDGYNDLILKSAASNNIMKYFVLFGSTSGFPTNVGSLNGTNGFTVKVNEYRDNMWGRDMSFIRDINGDGIDELMISSMKITSTGPGMVYLIYGSKTWSTTIDLTSSLSDPKSDIVAKLSSKGLIFTDNLKKDPTSFGHASGNLGDINKDGKPDFGMTNQDTATTNCINGVLYVILDPSLVAGTTLKELDKVQFDGTNGFSITDTKAIAGDTYTCFGRSMAGIGDINEDGIDDFVVTGDSTDVIVNGTVIKDVGSVYVIFGQKNFTLGSFSVDQLNVSGYPKGFRINGKNTGDALGYGNPLGLDVNGDGINDLIVAAPYNDTGAIDTGEVYVIFGIKSPETFPQLFDLNTLNVDNGFVILGNGANYITGEMGIYSLGDVNKDGLSDFVIGNRWGAPWNSVVIYGGRFYRGLLKTRSNYLWLGNLDGTDGFSISDRSRVTGLGDTNGDGMPDYAIGVHDATVGSWSNAGKVLIVTRGAISQYVACSVPYRCITSDSIFDPLTQQAVAKSLSTYDPATQKAVSKSLSVCQTTESCVTTGLPICTSSQKCVGNTLNTYDPATEAKYPTATYDIFNKGTQAIYTTATQAVYDKGSQATYLTATQATYVLATQAVYDKATQKTYLFASQGLYDITTEDKYLKAVYGIFDKNTQQVVAKGLSTYDPTTQKAVNKDYISCQSTQKCLDGTIATYDLATQAVYITATQDVFNKGTQAIYSIATQAAYTIATQGIYDKGTQAPYFTATQDVFSKNTQAVYDKATQAVYAIATQSTYDKSTQGTYTIATQGVYIMASQAIYDKGTQKTYLFGSQGLYDLSTEAKYPTATQSTYNIGTEAKYPTATQAVYPITTHAVYEKETQGTYDKGTQNTYNTSIEAKYNLGTEAKYPTATQSTYDKGTQSTYNLSGEAKYNTTTHKPYSLISQRVYEKDTQDIFNISTQSVFNISTETKCPLGSICDSQGKVYSPSEYEVAKKGVSNGTVSEGGGGDAQMWKYLGIAALASLGAIGVIAFVYYKMKNKNINSGVKKQEFKKTKEVELPYQVHKQKGGPVIVDKDHGESASMAGGDNAQHGNPDADNAAKGVGSEWDNGLI